MIGLFNADPLSRGPDQESERNVVAPGEAQSTLSISIESTEQSAKAQADTIVNEWITCAKSKGTTDILEETGEHEDFFWQIVRKDVGLEY